MVSSPAPVEISKSRINPSSWPLYLPESAVHSPQRVRFANFSFLGWLLPRQVGWAWQELAEQGSPRRKQEAWGMPAPPLPGDQALGRCQTLGLPDLLLSPHVQTQHSLLLASPSRTLQTASPDGRGCRLLPAHFPFSALSLSQGSSGKLAERDIFHALDSSAGWLSLPPLPPVSSPAGHPDPGGKIFGQLVAAHLLFNFICNFISLGLSF